MKIIVNKKNSWIVVRSEAKLPDLSWGMEIIMNHPFVSTERQRSLKSIVYVA